MCILIRIRILKIHLCEFVIKINEKKKEGFLFLWISLKLRIKYRYLLDLWEKCKKYAKNWENFCQNLSSFENWVILDRNHRQKLRNFVENLPKIVILSPGITVSHPGIEFGGKKWPKSPETRCQLSFSQNPHSHSHSHLHTYLTSMYLTKTQTQTVKSWPLGICYFGRLYVWWGVKIYLLLLRALSLIANKYMYICILGC